MVPHAIVVADETEATDAVSLALRGAGFDVLSAANGAVALRSLDSDEFDLVVLDVTVPDVSGLELLREIRTKSDLPVIMLGAANSEAERVLGLEPGGSSWSHRSVRRADPRSCDVAAALGRRQMKG